MSTSSRSPFFLLLLALAALLVSTIAEPLPNDLVVVIPDNGTIANSTDGVSTYSLDNTGRAGDYLQNVVFTLTYPNGTSSAGGGVSSGGCITREGFYTFGFNNSQAGDYVLEAELLLAPKVDGSCAGPDQIANFAFPFTLVAADAEGGAPTPNRTTTTATFAEAPTGTYTPTEPVSGASRTAVGALAALVVGGSVMALAA
ncbi:hypothetical protein BCR35DRAFT_355868 [Leucosporidium creatinivorum]|uniref:Ser-Thr-rich glycosyl-phosphatidyl-inositol-anchored membrane family-domain-containing protein n=1 Tax=Leucosporidium creatinivorum TaxID=106004 RepID=A0A1Y2D7K6_9BASI|nr:hypothetical protein BCR35DRAFT_355868 [Leucosporidium creatinivorum]